VRSAPAPGRRRDGYACWRWSTWAPAPETATGTAEHALATAPRPFESSAGHGEDGHTASLFPARGHGGQRSTFGGPEQGGAGGAGCGPHRRVSLTLRALLDTRAVVILIQAKTSAPLSRSRAEATAHHPIAAFMRQRDVQVHVDYNYEAGLLGLASAALYRATSSAIRPSASGLIASAFSRRIRPYSCSRWRVASRRTLRRKPRRRQTERRYGA